MALVLPPYVPWTSFKLWLMKPVPRAATSDMNRGRQLRPYLMTAAFCVPMLLNTPRQFMGKWAVFKKPVSFHYPVSFRFPFPIQHWCHTLQRNNAGCQWYIYSSVRSGKPWNSFLIRRTGRPTFDRNTLSIFKIASASENWDVSSCAVTLTTLISRFLATTAAVQRWRALAQRSWSLSMLLHTVSPLRNPSSVVWTCKLSVQRTAGLSCFKTHSSAEMAAVSSARTTVCRTHGRGPWESVAHVSSGRFAKTTAQVAKCKTLSWGYQPLPSVKRCATGKSDPTWLKLVEISGNRRKYGSSSTGSTNQLWCVVQAGASARVSLMYRCMLATKSLLSVHSQMRWEIEPDASHQMHVSFSQSPACFNLSLV